MTNFILATKGLTDEERAEAGMFFVDQGLSIENHKYEERMVSAEEVIKFVFHDFSLISLIRDGLLWSAFTKAMDALWKWSHTKKPDVSVGGWVIDIESTYSLNVIFPNEIEDLQKMLEQLPEFLAKNESAMEGKIVWVRYISSTGEIEMQIVGDR